ncbi:MAG: HAD-IC family P-type ATPase [Lachnospiraceae bacterium]|nr:HAD-IC family P-type ATPase [Lachnospiraceae bacterium]
MNEEKITGLNQAEVKTRVQAGQVNIVRDGRHKTKKQIILSHTLTYFNFLNLFLGILIVISGQYKNLLFLGVIISNSAIGIFQELKVKSLIDKLSVITAQKANVIRDGTAVSLPIEQIVMDDVLVLASGDQICTDSIVLSSDGMEVNESMLTGESKPVKKKTGDHLFSGSFIVAGNGVGQVEHVGSENYAVQLAQKAKTKKRATSEMQNTIKKIIQVVSVAIIPIGLLLYYSQYQAHTGDYKSALVSTAAGVIGMIPEGLVLLTSVSFVLGVGRLARKRAMVQEMEAIEALARVNVLCTDKTGTITTGNLEVVEVVPFGDATPDTIKTVMNEIAFAFDDTNATQDALMHYFQKTDAWTATAKIPFSSARKFRAISFSGHGSYVLGAPEYLVRKESPVLQQIVPYSEDGYRVLLLGQTDQVDTNADTVGTVTPLGAIVISDVIRTDAKETFAYFAKEGVAIKVISGDNPATVSSIAVKAGLKGGESYVDATTLPTDPKALGHALMQYTVFGRVKPEQKQDFVKAFQANKKTVAMIGDGVNDVLAIKDADCGIAMAAGSDAAKQAAHIVLLDSDFKSMKDIVQEGRMIISNIERVSALYLTKTIYSMLLCLFFILLQRDYPFTPLQLGLISITAIGIPSFFLTLEQSDKVTSDGFLKHVLQVSLPAALTMVVSLLIIQGVGALFHFDNETMSTFNLVTGGIISMLVVIQVSSPLSTFRKILVSVCCGLFALVILILHRFYGIHSIFMWWSLLFIPFAVLIMMMLYWFSRGIRHLQVVWVHRKAQKNK